MKAQRQNFSLCGVMEGIDMKEIVCLMLTIFAALGVVMLGGALIDSGFSLPVVLGLAGCVAAARGFYLLGTQPAGQPRRPARRHSRPNLRLAGKPDGLRAA